MYLLIRGKKRGGLHIYGILPQNPQAQSNYEKTLRGGSQNERHIKHGQGF